MAEKKVQQKAPTQELQIELLRRSHTTFHILGSSPFIYNAMSAKAKEVLLFPEAGKKTMADKQANIKHDPIAEFRDSVYYSPGDGPSRLVIPAAMFKKAAMNAALDTPDAKKTQIGRLMWVDGINIDFYGIPHLLMSVVRSADMNRTPDIRTRAIVPFWACKVTVYYAEPALKQNRVANILANAGDFIGIGDFRQEKGAGNFGRFSLVGEDDPTWAQIVKKAGRVEQDKALANALPYDTESERMLSWFLEEAKRRERKVTEAGNATYAFGGKR